LRAHRSYPSKAVPNDNDAADHRSRAASDSSRAPTSVAPRNAVFARVVSRCAVLGVQRTDSSADGNTAALLGLDVAIPPRRTLKVTPCPRNAAA
jgi:hypothetical protein